MTNERNDRMFRLSELERRMISYGHVPSADLKEVENDVTEARKRLDLKEDNLYLSEAAKVLKNPGLAVETYESEDFAGRGDQAYENLHEFWCLTWFKHDITISAKMEITSFLAHLTKENQVEDVDRLLFYIEKMDENLPDLTEEFKQFFIQELLWLMGKWLFLKDKNSNLREVSLLVIQAFTEISVPEQLIILGKNSVLCRVEEAGKVLCIIAERFGFEKFYTLLDLENVNGKLQALFPECVNIIKYDSFQVDEIKLQSAFRSMEKAETYDVSIHRDEVVGFLHNNPTESNFLSYDIFQVVLDKLQFSCKVQGRYQHRSRKGHSYWGNLTGYCKLGRCKITVKILDEPMMCTKVNITVKIEGLIGGKTLHSNLKKARVVGEDRKRLGKVAEEESSYIAYMKQYSKSIDDSQATSTLGAVQKMKADQKDPREDILRTIRILKQNGVARNEIYIRSFEEENLRVLFFDKEQLEYTRKLHKDHSWENPLIVAFDSSGKLFNYPLTGKGPRKHVGVLNFAGVGPGGVCLMEQVSEKSTKVELSLGLTEWSVSVGVKDPIAQIYISDFSWPIINSVFNSLMKTSVEKYLDERFEAMMNQEPPSETTAVYLIDKLHLVPIFLKRARQMAGKEVGDLFCKVVKILTARSLMAIRKLWVAAMKVFAGEDVSEQNKEDLVEICGRIDLGVVEKSLQNLENVDDCYEVQEFGASALRKKTKSFRYFSKIFEQYVDVCGSDDESRNPYKCKELMNYFLSEYLGLLPFFTLAVFGEDSQLNYPTSTQVELYWRFMKQNVFYKQNVKDVKTADYFGRVQAFNRSKIREQISKEKQEKKMKKQRKQRKQQRYEDTEEDEVEEEEEAWTAKKIPAKKVKRNSHLGVTFRF